MTESKRRRVFSCAEEDRISNLQEHLLDSILERVPIEDAARTSILSRKWRHTWRNMRALVFDKHFSNKFAKNGAFRRKGFIRIINHVLFLHKGPILTFLLHIPGNIPPDSFQEVDQWMYFLSRNGVTEIVLTNSNQLYKLPCYMFCCRELRKLKLKHCLFKPPLEFKAFLNLEDLELTNIDFGDNLCGSQISLPQLKTLSLYMCTNVCKFTIKATNLQSLVVLTGPTARSSVRILRGPYITIFGIHDFVGGERKDLSKELSHLPEIKDVHIDSIFLKEPRVGEGPALNHLESSNCLDCTLNQLELVEITDLQGSRPELLFIELLLAHSPSLQKFTVAPSRVSIAPSRVSDVKKRLDITINGTLDRASVIPDGAGLTDHTGIASPPTSRTPLVTPPNLSAETSEGGDFMYVSQHIHK
ncbi:hypothetical protein LXL04_033494 [Taraxacum kok-saghyz]